MFNRDDVGGGDDGVGDVVGDGGDDDNVGDDSGGVQCPAEMMVIAVCQEARCHPAVPASQKTVHHNEEEDKDNKDKEEEEEKQDARSTGSSLTENCPPHRPQKFVIAHRQIYSHICANV